MTAAPRTIAPRADPRAPACAIAVVALVVGTATAAAPIRSVVPLRETFEQSSRIYTSYGTNGGTVWSRVATHAHAGGFSIHTDVGEREGESFLLLNTALVIPADATAATLTFWHLYDFESVGEINYDGGLLEFSTDGGVTWSDGGASIVSGGYTGAISNDALGNPIFGRPAWVFTSPAGWAPVTVDLLPYRGTGLLLRWRLGFDRQNIGAPGGWWIDDVQIAYDAPGECAGGWSAAPVYPLPITSVAAVALDGTIYAFGGRNSTVRANAYSYTPGSGLWTPIAALPEPRRDASALTDGRYIYILGGQDDRSSVTGTLWRYDPIANSYVTLAPYTVPTYAHAAAYMNGMLFRIAGETRAVIRSPTASVEAYTIATDSWAPLANHPQAVRALSGLASGGFLYTAGGVNEEYSAQTYRYDPGTNTWDDGPIADLPRADSADAAGALLNGRWIVLTGNMAVLGWVARSNTWYSLDHPPQPVLDAGTVILDEALYIIGGLVGDSFVDLVQQYAESDCVAPTPTLSPSPTATPPIVPSATATTSTLGCAGDCGADGRVAVAELVRGVAIALGQQPLAECEGLDLDASGTVAVNELVAAVNNALHGC